MNPIIRREMYDISLLDKRFTYQFKKYVTEHKYVVKRSIVDDDDDKPVFEFEHGDNSLTSAEYRRVVDELIPPLLKFGGFFFISLVQFWRAEEERVEVNNNNISVGERRFLLTLRNQPFLLYGFHYSYGTSDDELCRYRTKMHDVIVNGDGTGGPIGCVFLNNRIEFTPDVSFYSDNEFPHPQRDIAKSCGIRCSLVLPWRDYDGSVVGAIECVVGTIEFVSLLKWRFLNILLRNPLFSGYCRRLCGQYDSEKDSLISAVSEINEVLGEICERRDVVCCAQTWMLCKHCNSFSTVKRCAKQLKASSQYFIYDYDNFLEYQNYYNLKKGEGVVGKAAESSHDLVYCEDVAKFRITEYPLAHFARYRGLSASFAISLKSIQTGDQVYVLEFFLHPDYVKGKNLRATLVSILATIWQCFKTFMFASGEEIGDSLSVLVIDANSPDKVKILETSLQDISREDAPVASSSSVQSEIRVTIEAINGVDSTRFPLSASSGIHELYHQVSQRLQRADTTFYLKYRDDDNDLIELTCDEDLQLYISSSREQEIYTLPVVVVPR